MFWKKKKKVDHDEIVVVVESAKKNQWLWCDVTDERQDVICPDVDIFLWIFEKSLGPSSIKERKESFECIDDDNVI